MTFLLVFQSFAAAASLPVATGIASDTTSTGRPSAWRPRRLVSPSLPLSVEVGQPGRWRIIAPRVKGMTSADALHRQPHASHEPVLGQGHPRVLRAARLEAAGRRQQRADRELIPAQQAIRDSDEQDYVASDGRPAREPGSRPCRRSMVNTSPKLWTSTSNDTLWTKGRPTKTTDMSDGRAARSCRNAARSRRLARFRLTAPRTCRLTVNPTFCLPGVGIHRATNAGRSTRLPRSNTA